MKLSELVSVFESYAPLDYQESYDNAGLVLGDLQMEVNAALLCLDVHRETIDEAVGLGANLIISHHPLLFHPLKNLRNDNPVADILLRAAQKGIALYSAHTNLDNVINGVNQKISQKLNLQHRKVLSPMKNALKKVVVFVPLSHADQVRKSLFDAGAGKIGAYDNCSYNVEGQGTFRGSGKSNPFVGEKGKLHVEKEVRIETVFPATRQKRIVEAILAVHPYEEVAYDIYPIDNEYAFAGSGMMGYLDDPPDERHFLKQLKEIFGSRIIRHSALLGKTISKVALCGGSGAFLIPRAKSNQADVFITADLKYHDFLKAEGRILLVDIGHYESEQFTIELFYEILTKNFHNFAIHFSQISSNPINYY